MGEELQLSSELDWAIENLQAEIFAYKTYSPVVNNTDFDSMRF